MSTHTLASYTAAGITLTTAGYDLSPFTITSAGTIQDGGVSNGIAVFSSIADPTLVNDGSINTYEGIKLTNGATVINNAILRGAAKRSANGYSYIASLVYVSGGEGVVLNNAKIHSYGGYDVQFKAGGYLSNSSAGYMYSFEEAVLISGAAGTVINAGRISAFDLDGVILRAGGTVTNEAGALIEAGFDGVVLFGNATLTNAGTIEDRGITGLTVSSAIQGENGAMITNSGTILVAGTAGQGLRLFGGGVVSNDSSTALIIGAQAGIYTNSLSSALTVVNAGTIMATQSGAPGIFLGSGGTVTNAGTIAGAGAALVFAGTTGNLLVVDAGAVFSGDVEGSTSAANSLELAAGPKGTISGIGSQFTGFQTIDFDSGASWLAAGSSAGLAAGQTINGFAVGDTIILDGFVAKSGDTSFVSGVGLELTDGMNNEVTLDITGGLSTANFLVTDLGGDTEIEAVCYLRGTLILTPAGEIPVENLRIGDAVVTKFGGYRPVKWIGRQSYDRRFVRHDRERLPVRIRAGALGGRRPKRDLYVSPGHSMLIDGVLVLAKALVNGVTITQGEAPEAIHYYQLEFETHDCVLAEGAWSESYADTPDWRAKFHNAAEFYELYPAHVAPDRQILCAPRPMAGIALDRVLRPIVAAAAAGARLGALRGHVDEVTADGRVRGWAMDMANPDLPVLLEILARGRVIGAALACQERADVARAGFGGGRCGFEFASPVGLPAAGVEVRRAADGARLETVEQESRAA